MSESHEPQARHATLQSSDGLSLATVHWPLAPIAGPARAHILIVHGLGEHSGRYAEMAHRLNSAGFEVHAYDQRGHGRTDGARGAIPTVDALFADLALVIDAVRAQTTGPLVLLGHSMGGFVSSRFVAEGLRSPHATWQREVDALVLSSPALAADLTAFQKLQLAIGALFPNVPAPNGLKPEWISRDPATVRAYLDDPLVHDRITPRLARAILAGGEFVRQLAPRWRVPTLLLWAGADLCVAPSGSQAMADAAPAAMLTAQRFEGLYHEIFNELAADREQVFAALLSWLEKRFGPTNPTSLTR